MIDRSRVCHRLLGLECKLFAVELGRIFEGADGMSYEVVQVLPMCTEQFLYAESLQGVPEMVLVWRE
jgi:hypothetical protein